MATKYRMAVIRVLNHGYDPPSLVTALDTVIKTAMERVVQESKEEIARNTCIKLHDGAGAGLICKRCFDQVEAGHLPPDDDTPEVQEPLGAQRADIESQVLALVNMSDEDQEA